MPSPTVRPSLATATHTIATSLPSPPLSPTRACSASTDPTTHPDIFHLVLSYLAIADLVRAELVSQAWLGFIRGNGALWRLSCLDAGIDRLDAEEMGALAAKCRASGRSCVNEGGSCKEQTPWRYLCGDRLPGLQAWRQATPARHNSRTAPTGIVELPALSCLIALQAHAPPLMCDRTLAPLCSFETKYTHVAHAGHFVAGARSASHLHDSALPLAPPSTLELWSVVTSLSVVADARVVHAPNGALRFVTHLHLPPVWVYDLKMVHGARGTVLAMLCAHARCVNSSPQASEAHWVSGRGERSVHLWFLASEEKKIVPVPESGSGRSLCLTDEYLLLPSGANLHIYALPDNSHLCIPLTPVGASLATIVSLVHRPTRAEGGNVYCTPYALPFAPYSEGSGLWHDAHALANFGAASIEPTVSTTSEHVVYVTERGALGVLHNYRNMIPQLFKYKLASAHLADIASASTALIACFPLLSRVEANGDRVAAIMRSRGSVFTLDAATLPSPPTRPPSPSPGTGWRGRFSDLRAHMWRLETDTRKYEAFRSPTLVTGQCARLALHGDKHLLDLTSGGLTRHSLILAYRDRRRRRGANALVVRWGDPNLVIGTEL